MSLHWWHPQGFSRGQGPRTDGAEDGRVGTREFLGATVSGAPGDVDRIKEAYHILLTRLENPPSLVDLSLTVGLNRNKLNRGFKVLYGGTAFTLLRQARLSKARLLLGNSDLSLSEIAFTVGYNSQANFTTAFRRFFGTPPNTFRR